MRTFLTISIIIGLSSCSSYYYIPTMQNVMLFKDKNEIRASAGIDEYEMSCFQGGYSITNHFGTQLEYMSRRENDDFLVEGGVGYYFRFREYLAFEAFGGFGHGVIDRKNHILTLGFNRVYLQPTLGFVSNYFDLVFTPRFSKVDYSLDIKEDMSKPYAYTYDIYNMDKHSYYFFEPGITIRLGYKYFKVQYQYISANKQNRDILKYLDTNHSVSVILIIPLNNFN
jgi:hypothetical protein